MISSDSVWLNFFSELAVVGCIVVIVGVVLEGAELIVKSAKKRTVRKWVGEVFGKHRRRAVVSCAKYIKPRILPFEAWGFVLLVFGLGIETLGSLTADRMQSKENSELELMVAQTGTTNAQLSLRVEGLRKLNDELEAKQTRAITLQQRDRFIDLLKNDPKCPVRIFIESDDIETKIYANQIREMLDGAGYGCGNTDGITKVEVSIKYPIGDPTRDLPVHFLFFGNSNQIINWPSFQWNFTNVGPSGYVTGHFWTNDVSGTPGMIGDAFQKIGIKASFQSSETYYFLKPGEWGVLVPQKF
jgi:hypothetical protein